MRRIMSGNWREHIESYTSCVIALAVFLFAAPWVWGYSGVPRASWSAWISAMVVAGLAVVSWVWPPLRAERANLFGGLWLILAPWALHFTESSGAFWTHVCVGAGVMAFAAAETWILHRASWAEMKPHQATDLSGSYRS
ncbi:hypothetical protein MZTS_22085 [Methylorubrum zatmanii]|nr:hypothetical protein [Methylorubrum zatmanii]